MSTQAEPRLDARVILGMAAIAVVYFGAAKLGLSLSVAHGNATPVWAPTGIAIATLALFGRRFWPGVLLGAFLANATTPVPLWTTASIAVGNTLEATLGVSLLGRLGFMPRMDRARDVLTLVGAAGILAPIVSATIGIAALSIAGEVPSGDHLFRWGVWWVGDAMGAVLVAPFLLAWFTDRSPVSFRSAAEALGILGGLVAIGVLVFPNEPPAASFLVFPMIVWATLRFGQRGATSSVVIAAAFGIGAILGGARPFGGVTATESVALLQALMGLLAVSSLLVSASISERERAEASLRTEARLLAAREAQLEEAQRVALMGSWEWDMGADRIDWSNEMFRIYGYEPQEFEVTFERAQERVVPEDRAAIQSNIEQEIAAGPDSELSPVEYRIALPDGSERVLHGRGHIIFEGGTPQRMIGTVQDVTERRRAEANEARLREVEANHRHALELNDEVIQGLAVAKMALELGQIDDASAALDSTIASVRGIVADLLSQNADSGAGRFRRRRAARS